jgi:hypothetical protein
MSMHINEDRESQLLLVGLEKRVMRYRLAAPLGLNETQGILETLEFHINLKCLSSSLK